jgi:hypothetical protein
VLARGTTALALYTRGTNFKFKPDGVSSSGRWSLNTSRRFTKVLVYKKSNGGGEIYLGDYLDTVAKPADEYFFVRFRNATLRGFTHENWTTFTCQPNGRSQRIYLPRAKATWSDPSEEDAHVEGAVVPVMMNRFERDPKARKKCINHYGCICQVCELDFASKYGADIGRGFIHVHHLVSLSKIRKSYIVDPVKDLIPVCPNCHAMLHKGDLSPRQLRARVEA